MHRAAPGAPQQGACYRAGTICAGSSGAESCVRAGGDLAGGGIAVAYGIL